MVDSYESDRVVVAFGIRIAIQWLAALLFAIPAERSDCEALSACVASVYVIGALYITIKRPYRCGRDDILEGARYFFFAAALSAQGISYSQLKAGGDVGTSFASEVQYMMLQAATVAIMVKLAFDCAALGWLLITGRSSQMQLDEWKLGDAELPEPAPAAPTFSIMEPSHPGSSSLPMELTSSVPLLSLPQHHPESRHALREDRATLLSTTHGRMPSFEPPTTVALLGTAASGQSSGGGGGGPSHQLNPPTHSTPLLPPQRAQASHGGPHKLRRAVSPPTAWWDEQRKKQNADANANQNVSPPPSPPPLPPL